VLGLQAVSLHLGFEGGTDVRAKARDYRRAVGIPEHPLVKEAALLEEFVCEGWTRFHIGTRRPRQKGVAGVVRRPGTEDHHQHRIHLGFVLAGS